MTVTRITSMFAGAVGAIALGSALFSGCCTEDSVVVRLHHVDLSESQAAIVRAEKLIKDFGLEVEDVEYGARNGTFINITVTGREKRFAEKYFDEREKRLQLERKLREAGASD